MTNTIEKALSETVRTPNINTNAVLIVYVRRKRKGATGVWGHVVKVWVRGFVTNCQLGRGERIS